MKKLIEYVLILLLIMGCAGKSGEKSTPTTRAEAIAAFYKIYGDATNPENWQILDKPEKAIFCEKQIEGCTNGKVYPITRYLPKKFLGNECRFVIFTEDTGVDTLFCIKNLPNKEDEKNIEEQLKKIDP